MESVALLGGNLISPPIIAFFAGAFSIWARSDLRIPDQLYQALTIYLLLAIGFKGGIALSQSNLAALAAPLIATLCLGAAIPVFVYAVSRRFLKTNVSDAAALGAHYGSVSAVTFMACLAFLDRYEVAYEAFMPAIMAVMELPAIFTAMLIAKAFSKDQSVSLSASLREVLSGKTFVLLICGLLAGLLAKEHSRELIHPFLIAPFYGALMLFLLEMGQVAAGQFGKARELGGRLVTFAIAVPVLTGATGLLVGYVIGLSQGGAVVFGILTASASYIAAPAAVRAALPKANPGVYVTASLGITFPFNLAIGIPLIYLASGLLY